MLVASLRDVIRNQAAEMERLQSQLKTLSTASGEVSLVSIRTVIVANIYHV